MYGIANARLFISLSRKNITLNSMIRYHNQLLPNKQ